VWDFPRKKIIVGSKTKKFAAKFATVGFKSSSTNISKLESRGTNTHGGRSVIEESATEIRYDRGLEFEASLETRVYTSCPWGTFTQTAREAQSEDDWFERFEVLKPEFPCGSQCAVFKTRMVSIQGRIHGPWMGVLCGLMATWPKTRNLYTIVSWSRRRKPTGPGYQQTNLLLRWKSANWKDSKPPKPSSNVAVLCPGCKEMFWKRYLYKHIFQNHVHFMMTPTILSSISMYPHDRDYVKSLFENPGKPLTSKCPKNDKNPHDCDCTL